ncbi:MAG: DUF2153 family protein [Acidilobaceae archaeon]
MSSSQRDIKDFLRSLERWVSYQKYMLDSFRHVDSKIENADRLDMVIHTRAAFSHLIRTLKAFDDWMQDPLIASVLTKEQLLEVWKTTMRILELLLNLDMSHTSEVKNTLEKLYADNKLSPVLFQARWVSSESREEQERRWPSISI